MELCQDWSLLPYVTNKMVNFFIKATWEGPSHVLAIEVVSFFVIAAWAGPNLDLANEMVNFFAGYSWDEMSLGLSVRVV